MTSLVKPFDLKINVCEVEKFLRINQVSWDLDCDLGALVKQI
jgi:hypothetical protein